MKNIFRRFRFTEGFSSTENLQRPFLQQIAQTLLEGGIFVEIRQPDRVGLFHPGNELLPIEGVQLTQAIHADLHPIDQVIIRLKIFDDAANLVGVLPNIFFRVF